MACATFVAARVNLWLTIEVQRLRRRE